MSHADFLVQRTDLSNTGFVDASRPDPEAGEAVLAVERFALTANNITYGVAGDSIGYWQFFPAPEGKGRIPVWGIGHIESTNADGIPAGQRFYGYYPMSSTLTVKPGRISAHGFSDTAAHRSGLPPVYNQYALMTPESGFDPAYDNHQMIYRPLFTTSFVLDDYLQDNSDFGAEMVVIGSASSKTGFGLAYMLKQSGRVRIAGLTSAANKDFVAGLGLYDDVFSYDEVASLDSAKRAVYVDMSGNRAVLAQVHHHFGDNLVCSCGVGITHHDQRNTAAPASMPGAKPTMFFAPSQIQKRSKEWGAEVYQQRLGQATAGFLAKVDDWVTIEEHTFSALPSVYQTVLDGASPDRAFIVVVGDA